MVFHRTQLQPTEGLCSSQVTWVLSQETQGLEHQQQSDNTVLGTIINGISISMEVSIQTQADITTANSYGYLETQETPEQVAPGSKGRRHLF